MKEPHTALFVAPTGVGKTHLALNLLEKEYNETYRSRKWVWTDLEVILMEPGNSLHGWIEKIGNLFGWIQNFILD